MRVLILGANGMLGTDILKEWRNDELIPATSRDADIRDFNQVRKLIAHTRPEWIVLSAAYTDVDGCESNRELAFAVNATGPANVARAANELGAKVFHISTDYLFDGAATQPYEIDHRVAPLNVYGESKAAGELAIRETASHWCIGRTSWLFGAKGPSFPEKILRASESKPELSVVNDQVGSPTFTRDLANSIRELVHKNAQGIVHITNSGVCSWFDLAREILRQAGRESIPVHPTTSDKFPRPAKRPAYSVLSPRSLHSFHLEMRPWQEAVTGYLQDMKSSGKLA